MHINKKDWYVCKLCGLNIKQLANKYGKSGKYFTQVFVDHLKFDHSLVVEDYFKNKPLCPCGCGAKRRFKTRYTSNFEFKKFGCSKQSGWSEKAKEGRRGKYNPMYGKKPWNK